MFDKFMRLFRSMTSGMDSQSSDRSSDAAFILKLDSLPMLMLVRKNGVWIAQYTDEFKAQNRVKPLVAFPNVEKTYTSQELWPFFAIRIPSIARPEVVRTVEQEELDYEDSAAMLRRFGGRSIADPFELESKRPLVAGS